MDGIGLKHATVSALKRTSARGTSWLRRGDGFRFVLAATALAGVLLALFFMVPALRPIDPVEAEAARAAQKLAQAKLEKAEHERRLGSIVYASHSKYCEEFRFDNRTGQTLSFDYVDCEARLVRPVADNAQEKKRQSMRGVLDSFKR